MKIIQKTFFLLLMLVPLITNGASESPREIPKPSEHTASIEAIAWLDSDFNGIRINETGIPDVLAYLYDNEWNFINKVVTNESGSLFFTNLEPGDYNVCFAMDTFPADHAITEQNAGPDQIDSDTLDDGCNDLVTVIADTNSKTHIGLTPPRGSDLSGELNTFVWIDANMDGLQNNDESGLPDVDVWLFDSNWDFVVEGVTEDDGYFNFTKLKLGEYYICFDTDDFPAGFLITEQNADSNDAIDSDAFEDGCTDTITVTGRQVSEVALGLYSEDELPPMPACFRSYHASYLELRGEIWARGKADPGKDLLYGYDYYELYNRRGEFMGKTSDLVNERVYRVNAHNRWYAWMRRWSFTDNKQFLNNHIYTHMFTNSVIVGVKNGRSSEPVKCHYKVGTSTPIAFDLNADGKIGVTGESTARDAERNVFGSTVEFDMLGTDKPITMEWFAGDGDGILIDNRDGQAATDMNGKRLFGDQNGQFEHGYQRLALFDINTDGVLTATELQGLQLWVDNGDAIVQPGELQSLKAWKIASISVQMTLVDGMMRSTATTTSGQQIMTEDVWFSVVPAVASTTPSIVSTLTVSLAALLAILMAAFVFVRQQKTVVTQDNAMRPELES